MTDSTGANGAATGRVAGQVRIVGTGLLGASIGHALVARGVDVILQDSSRTNQTLAIDYGAGRAAAPGDDPELVIVAVPPDATADVVAAELKAWPRATVTDVASVKSGILHELETAGADTARYIGSHPMAGRERGGAISARADIFIGRPWVIGDGDAARRRLVEDLAIDLGAVPVSMSAVDHDAGVALVSHVPQVVATLLARRLGVASDPAVALAGQGLRDTTRIAASNPELWVQILGANAEPVVEILRAYRDDLDAVLAALESPDAPGARRAIAELLAGGNAGVARIPGKHGQANHFSQLVIMVNDKPGELARLLTEIGEAGVNMEDLRLEHSPGAQFGLAEISVLPEAEASLAAELESRGWKIVGAGMTISTGPITVVAIDGPAGSGKSSVSKAAAGELGFDYLDTGAAYRALAWRCLEEGIDTYGPAEVIESLSTFDFVVGIDPGQYFVRVGSETVTDDIREPRVTSVVSAVARIPEVRAFMVDLFRGVIRGTRKDGIIVEGRDITTVVAPDAEVRILLTASEEARMGRRSAELPGASAEKTARELSSRDAQDSRVVDFMNAAEGVTILDSTELDFDQTVQAVVSLVRTGTRT